MGCDAAYSGFSEASVRCKAGSGKAGSGEVRHGKELATAYRVFHEGSVRCVSIMGSARRGMQWRCRDWYGKVFLT